MAAVGPSWNLDAAGGWRCSPCDPTQLLGLRAGGGGSDGGILGRGSGIQSSFGAEAATASGNFWASQGGDAGSTESAGGSRIGEGGGGGGGSGGIEMMYAGDDDAAGPMGSASVCCFFNRAPRSTGGTGITCPHPAAGGGCSYGMHTILSSERLSEGGCCFGLDCRYHVSIETLINHKMAGELGLNRRQLLPVVQALQSNLVLTTAHLYQLRPSDLGELGLPLVARNWLQQLLLDAPR